MQTTGDIRVDEIMPELNEAWARMPFEECLLPAESNYRKLKQKELQRSGLIPVIDQGEDFIAGYTDKASNKYPGSLPVVIFGDHTRRVKYVDFEFAVGADGVKPLHPCAALDQKFFYYYLRALKLESQGYSRHYRFLKEIDVPIPPIDEQRHIVAQVEKLLSRVDATQERLATIPRILKRFRQSVLAAASSGVLTADWRTRQVEIETGTELLAHILKVRYAKWLGTNRTKKASQYKQPATTDEASAPDLPNSWTVTTIEALLRDDTSLSYGILKPGEYDPSGIPMLRVMDIGDGDLNDTEIFRVTPSLAQEYKRTTLEANDVLLAVMATVGRSMVVPAHLIGANVNRALAVLKLTELVDPNFACVVIRSPHFQDVFASEKIGSAQLRINLGDLRQFAFPLPPLPEQQEIVRRVEALFKTADALEARYLKAKAHVDKLTQSILAKAFRGELVPQDPNDEPATVLLERIHQKRNGTGSKKPRSRK